MRKLSIISITLLLGYACLADATDLLSDKPAQPWDWTERELQRDGFDTSTKSLLLIAKTHQEERAGLSAIAILGWRGEQSAKGVLRELLLEGADELVRQAAALALARLGDAEGLEVLTQFFFEETGGAKAYLAARLAELGQDVGYSQTLELSYSPKARVRSYSLRALFILSKVAQGSPKRSRELADRICVLSQDPDLGVRREFLIQASGAVAEDLREICLEGAVRRMSMEEADAALKEMAERRLLSWELRRERELGGDKHEN